MMLAGSEMIEVLRPESDGARLNVSVRMPLSDGDEDVVKISPCALLSSGSVGLMIVFRVEVGMVGSATAVSQIPLMSPDVRLGRELRGSGLMLFVELPLKM